MRKRYKNSPIIEALCEFQFVPDTSQDFDSLVNLMYEKVSSKFPKRFRLQLQTSQISVGNLGTPEIAEQLLPLARFQNSNEHVLMQLGQNFLSINHLKPYTSWEEFLPSVKMGLDAYREVVNPESILRIALRYINRIEITSKRINLEDYFEFRPFLKEKILQDMSAFTLGIQLPRENVRDILNVQLASIDSEMANTVATVLDLTYSSTKLEDITLANIADWLIIAHNHIEDAFEACITDQLRDLFEEVEE